MKHFRSRNAFWKEEWPKSSQETAIERNAELLKRLVSDLLDTTRIVSGKLHTEKN